MAVFKLVAIIVVSALLGILLLSRVVAFAIVLWRRRSRAAKAANVPGGLFPGFKRGVTPDLTTDPAPGLQSGPCTVHVLQATPSETACDILVNVNYTDTRTTTVVDTASSAAVVLGTDGFYSAAFLLYTAPLEFSVAGTYTVQAHTVYPLERRIGPVLQYTFSITAFPQAEPPPPLLLQSGPSECNLNINANMNHRELVPAAEGKPPQQLTTAPTAHATVRGMASLLPPSITPHTGTVTTQTPIVIAPHESSRTVVQLRYSVDGSRPHLLYTGPFCLSLPPNAPTASPHVVHVRAMAIAATEHSYGAPPVSEVTVATLCLSPAGYSFFDPTVPAPSLRLRARNASLYFDESKNPPSSRTCYQLLYMHAARQRVKFNPKKCAVYERRPIPLTENVAMIYAWTVDENRLQEPPRRNENSDDEDMFLVGLPATRMRSVATIYDCTRASTEYTKPSRRRTGGTDNMLPPPIVCVACDEMEVEFDDAPAHSILAYTLNDTEPALYDVSPPACAGPLGTARRPLDVHDKDIIPGDVGGYHTFHYQPGQTVHVTLLEKQGTYVTARYFMPIVEDAEGQVRGNHGGQGGSCGKLLGYRYSEVLHRGFFFEDRSAT